MLSFATTMKNNSEATYRMSGPSEAFSRVLPTNDPIEERKQFIVLGSKREKINRLTWDVGSAPPSSSFGRVSTTFRLQFLSWNSWKERLKEKELKNSGIKDRWQEMKERRQRSGHTPVLKQPQVKWIPKFCLRFSRPLWPGGQLKAWLKIILQGLSILLQVFVFALLNKKFACNLLL